MREETAPVVLVVEDEELLRWSLCRALEQRGCRALEAADAPGARGGAPHASAIVLDYRLPGTEGLRLLSELVEEVPRVPIVVVTAHGDVGLAVEAMRSGAFDYVPKPFELDDVCERVQRALSIGASGSNERLGLVARSPAMRGLVRWLELAGPSETTVLLCGETGSGKSRLARLLHRAGPRRDGPFVEVTCAAIPPALLESELFGHEAGAFSGASELKVGLFEAASGGTLFLDEIDELPMPAQAKLLRFLEESTLRRVGGTDEIRVDARVIAASQAPLAEAVERGRFRRDLFYRLCVLETTVPPLRERREDLPALVGEILDELGCKQRSIPRVAMRALLSHSWPGNVRELRNVIERSVMLHGRGPLSPKDLSASPSGDEAFTLPASGLDLEVFEREMLRQALERSHGNRTRAAELLGLSRDAVRYRIAKYGLEHVCGSARQRG